MAADPNVVELAVSRTLRDSLERIQRTSDELHQAVNDLVSACASSRPTNALPAMVRAQTSAASLSAVLEVLSRFVTIALRPAMEPPAAPAPEMVQPAILSQPPAEPQWHEPAPPAPMGSAPTAHAPEPFASTEIPASNVTSEMTVPPPLASEPPAPESVETRFFVPEPLAPQPMGIDLPLEEPSAGANASAGIPAVTSEDTPVGIPVSIPGDDQPSSGSAPSPREEAPAPESLPPMEHAQAAAEPRFDVSLLPSDLQELHRRAYRVAKVSMQDIKMLRPEDVRMGRENKDLCFRLRDDIEKAHKEYQRRFQPILSHPVDYFYDWMVEVLAAGDSEALGEYPYSSTVLHR